MRGVRGKTLHKTPSEEVLIRKGEKELDLLSERLLLILLPPPPRSRKFDGGISPTGSSGATATRRAARPQSLYLPCRS